MCWIQSRRANPLPWSSELYVRTINKRTRSIRYGKRLKLINMHARDRDFIHPIVSTQSCLPRSLFTPPCQQTWMYISDVPLVRSHLLVFTRILIVIRGATNFTFNSLKECVNALTIVLCSARFVFTPVGHCHMEKNIRK